VDVPTKRKNHARPMPLLGGVAVYLAATTGFLAFTRLNQELGGLIGGACVVLALGLLDDRTALRARFRLGIQVLCAAGLIGAGVHFEWFSWAPANYFVSVLWLVGLMNALNCLDCADGVSIGCAALAGTAFFFIALAHGHFAVAVLAVAVVGGCLGFLTFNFPPASIFLGDAGSTLVGFLLGGLAMASTRGAAPVPQAWMVGLPLAVPIWDIVLVHLRRYRAGARNVRDLLESAGRDHLPHRLQEAGLRPRQVALAVYLMAALLAAPGVMLAHYQQGTLLLAAEIALLGVLAGERPFGRFIAGLTRGRRSSSPTPPRRAGVPEATVASARNYAVQEALK